MSQRKIHVLIAAAGQGSRFNGEKNTPKQYNNLKGKPVLRRTIEKFLSMDEITSVQCIINPKHRALYDEATKDLNLPPPINGAETRQESVRNGLIELNASPNDIILIHDAARPLFHQNDVRALISALKQERAATLARPVAETLRESENKNCKDIVPREGLWSLQTPQAFYYEDILKAHEAFDGQSNQTDDTSLISDLGITVKLINASAENFKITTQSDMQMAEKILSTNLSTRTGLGYDVHAFDEESTGPIRIGGIDIPHDKKLKGHSDADVALHAITDAILGAIGQGDIGQHFPPSDNQFKDMDSAIFLEKSLKILNQNSAQINNIDLTIICEEPKIGPHAPKMRQRIASILNLAEARINIKATTSEQLGFTGRKEGIAAQAIATVTQYDE